MGTVLTMYAAGTGGTQDALAQVDVPKDGSLVGIEWSGWGKIDGDTEVGEAQVSFGSTGAFASNDARQIISQVSFGLISTISAVGVVVEVFNHYSPLPDINVNAGERIFLHQLASAGVTSALRVCLHFSFDLDQPKTRRR